MSHGFEVFRAECDVVRAIATTRERGYSFTSDALTDEALTALSGEINSLPLTLGDHVTNPINPGKTNEIRQHHARAYYQYGEPATPVANYVIDSLAVTVQAMPEFPELRAWRLTEIGYQRYLPSRDFIGPHRDRRSDRLLSLTLGIAGAALVRVFEPTGESSDYKNLRQIDEFQSRPGTAMMLAAPGFGNGEQKIHEVLPPEAGQRDIINLRMRGDVLAHPNDPRWQALPAGDSTVVQ